MAMPSLRAAVASWIRPGRRASAHDVRLCQSAITVAFIVFCFFLPDTDARRPPRPAGGRADLDLGGVQTQLDTFGLGVGKDIRQRP